MIPNIGPLEIGIVVLVALIIFGPKKLPELSKSVGSSVREFKNSVTGSSDKDSKEEKEKALEASEEAEVTEKNI